MFTVRWKRSALNEWRPYGRKQIPPCVGPSQQRHIGSTRNCDTIPKTEASPTAVKNGFTSNSLWASGSR
jgi:hypothetical protein